MNHSRFREIVAVTAVGTSLFAGGCSTGQSEGEQKQKTTAAANSIQPRDGENSGSIKDRARKCTFSAGKAAITAVIRSADTVDEKAGLKIYTYTPEQSVVSVKTEGNKALIDYEIHVNSDMDIYNGETPVGYATRGHITVPLSGSVLDSLEKIDEDSLDIGSEIDDRSGVFDLHAHTPPVLKNIAAIRTENDVNTLCDVIFDDIKDEDGVAKPGFLKALDIEYPFK